MPDIKDRHKLYTTQEAAQELGVTDSHIRNMIRTGKAQPAQRIGNSWVFTIDEIKRLRGRKRTTGKAKKQ
jgi:excisionase family DNA binding protein